MKKYLLYTFILVALFGPFAFPIKTQAAQPAPPPAQPNTTYHLLEPLPGLKQDFNVNEIDTQTGKNKALGTYLNIIIKLFIGFCAVLAVIMIVIGGVEYMTSELISGKEAGKDRIREALLGLLLALGAYTLLNTINPDLLNTDVGVGGSTLAVTVQNIKIIQQQIIPVGAVPNAKNAGSRGTPCDANVVFQAANDSGRPISAAQAQALSCIGGAESGGCKNVAANVPGVGSSAYGPFQILASNRARYGNTEACRQNPNSLECYSTMAAGLLRGRPQYQDWLTTQGPCANAMCIKLNDSSVDLNSIRIRAIPSAGVPDMSNGVGAYCRGQGYPI